MVVHLDQLLLEHRHVPVPVHGGLGGQKVQGAMAFVSAKTPPHHDTGGMLDIDHHIVLLVAVAQHWPPD